MGKVEMSKFLLEKKGFLQNLVAKLSEEYEYVSILGTDTRGKMYDVQRSGVNYNDSMWNERGFVVRVYNGVFYSEYSFNEIRDISQIVQEIREKIERDLEEIKASEINTNTYPVLEEKKIVKDFRGEVEALPGEVAASEVISRLTEIKDKALELSEKLINFRAIYEGVRVSKIFISEAKELEQSYVWSQGYLFAMAREGENTKHCHEGFSGLKGVELLSEMEESYQEIVETTEKLLSAERVEPGEYDIICTPSIAGVIAHEAFGHGVEMDMFVKNRAKAVDYLDKPVASKKVTMHDGATAAKEVSSYLFDDEGILGQDTVIIEDGILKTGISDVLSALKLETTPTGNGKRESFERKAYSRMTNTYFAPGDDELDDMIASIEKGYLLDKVMSGMEDPKNWGIQLMAIMGREIKNGELTGKIVSPVIITGYVPEVLKNISMVSGKVELGGAGACGKGYKELVKVSSGGPYIKTKARLG